ncbi:MAG TPA: DUF1992 domain-containing protein [Blastocatellia bacterium]|nr:DUF1992 domain-containing protein [Blastocatellia bacterium]
MAFERLVEEKIREAIQSGEFDDLPCAGKPLSLDEYFSTPEDQRLTYSVLKSAGILPREAELLKEVEVLTTRAAQTEDENKRKRLVKEAREKRLQYEIMMDRYRRGRRSRA